MDVKPIQWTFSKLQTFETCPRQYEAKYVTKEVPFVQSPEAEWGDAVHTALEHRLVDHAPLPPNMVQYERYARHVEGLGGQLYVESKLAVDRGHRPCAYDDYQNYWHRGKIDLLGVHEGERFARLFDWKTGKVKDDPLQLIDYCVLVFEHFPQVDTIAAGYIWLQFNKVSAPRIYRRADLSAMWTLFENKYSVMQGAHSLGVFGPRQSGLCNGWCEVTSCVYWKPKRDKR